MNRGMLAVLWFAVALLVSGDVPGETYRYSGRTYSLVAGGYTSAMRITRQLVTTTALPANMPMTPIGPGGTGVVQSWSFGDGANTYTSAESSLMYGDADSLAVATDAAGRVTGHMIALMQPAPPNTVGQSMDVIVMSDSSDVALTGSTCNGVSGDVCTAITYGSPSYGVSEAGGVFFAQAPVPTVGEWALVLLALAVLALGLHRIRSRSPSRHVSPAPAP